VKALRLVLLGALLWVALAGWALSSPVYSSPDDNYHLPMIYCAAGAADCTPEGERAPVCYAFQGDLPADCATMGSDVVPPAEEIRTGWYPPVYYTFSSLFVGDTVAETTATLRLLNSAIVVGLVLGSVLLTRARFRPAVIMSWLVCSIPLATFLFASVNPHSWTIAGLAALWGPLLSFLSTAPRARSVRDLFRPERRPWLPITQLAFVQLCALMALGSRTESPILLVVIVGAVSVFAVRWSRTTPKPPTVTALAVSAVLVLEAAITFALMASSRFALEAQPPQDAPYTPWRLVVTIFQLPLRAIADPELGWFDTPMPLLVQALGAGAFFAALIIGLRVIYLPKALALSVFAVGGLALMLYVLLNASSLYRYQPRYFLPLLFALVGLALLPRLTAAASRTGIPTKVQWVAITLAVVVVNALSLLNNSTRYVIGIPENPRSVIEAGDRNNVDPSVLAQADLPVWWWDSLPLNPWQVWVVGSIAFAGAALLLLTWVLFDDPNSRADGAAGTPADAIAHTPADSAVGAPDTAVGTPDVAKRQAPDPAAGSPTSGSSPSIPPSAAHPSPEVGASPNG